MLWHISPFLVFQRNKVTQQLPNWIATLKVFDDNFRKFCGEHSYMLQQLALPHQGQCAKKRPRKGFSAILWGCGGKKKKTWSCLFINLSCCECGLYREPAWTWMQSNHLCSVTWSLNDVASIIAREPKDSFRWLRKFDNILHHCQVRMSTLLLLICQKCIFMSGNFL